MNKLNIIKKKLCEDLFHQSQPHSLRLPNVNGDGIDEVNRFPLDNWHGRREMSRTLRRSRWQELKVVTKLTMLKKHKRVRDKIRDRVKAQ